MPWLYSLPEARTDVNEEDGADDEDENDGNDADRESNPPRDA
jgi:hypothetical protein